MIQGLPWFAASGTIIVVASILLTVAALPTDWSPFVDLRERRGAALGRSVP